MSGPARAARAAALSLALAGAGAAAAADVHVVKPGESLASIAEAKLGDRALWPVLYRANRDRIKDPARIYPGQELTLPDPESAAALPADGGAAEEDE